MPRPRKTPSPPTLTPAIVTDDAALTMAIEALLKSSASYRRQTRRVLRRQGELRVAINGEDAWQAFLAVEAAVNVRVTDAMHALVRWAFNEGARQRASGGVPSVPARSRRAPEAVRRR